MNIQALLLITSAIFISACSPYIVSANPNHSASKSDEKAEKIKNLFNEAHTTGVLVIQQGQTQQSYGNDLARASTEYVPASTFKMLNALIGLEHHKATTTEVFKWDGKKVIPRMGKGHDPRRCHESFRYSGLSRFSSSYWT